MNVNAFYEHALIFERRRAAEPGDCPHPILLAALTVLAAYTSDAIRRRLTKGVL